MLFKGRMMELQQLIREMHWIEWQLRTFEDKCGVLSRDFFTRRWNPANCPSLMTAKNRISTIFSNGMACTRCG